MLVLNEGYQFAGFVTVGTRNNENLFLMADDYIYGLWGKQSSKSVGMYRAIFYIPKNLLNSGVIHYNSKYI